MKKILRINMDDLTFNEERVKSEYEYLGGRALTSQIIKDEVDPACHPLGKHNKVVIAPGLLTGTTAPCSGRLSIGSKSPLTGTIKEANSGGTASQKLAKLGYKAIIIEGAPLRSGLYVIKIDSDGVEIIEADGLKGMGTYQTAKNLRDKYGNDYSVICIGPAGEEKLSAASIAVTNIEGETSRHAARGGLGAVLGSKGIKAIIVNNGKQDKQDIISYKDEKGFKKLATDFAKKLVETKKVLTEYGTANLVEIINSLKGLPTRNFSVGQFEGAEKISGEVLRKRAIERKGRTGHPCQPGCVIRCSNVYKDEKGNFLTSGFEYETIILTGANCGIDDLDTIAKIDKFCDDFGIDTIDTGAAIGVLMESGLIEFGDREGVLNLLEEIRKLTPLGRIIGSGAEITGKIFGVTRVPTVKGQAVSAYDPRVFKGTGVTYATSPMGADHTAGNCLPGRGGYREETKDASKIKHYEGDKIQVALSSDLQVMATVCDSLGFCYFVGATLENMNIFAELVNKRYGLSITGKDMIKLGQKTLEIEREFNKAAGITEVQDRLPEFFREEKLEPSGNVFDVNENEIKKVFDFS
mgnify:CR=1 FL=1